VSLPTFAKAAVVKQGEKDVKLAHAATGFDICLICKILLISKSFAHHLNIKYQNIEF
jgi:hypothetical protein